MLATTYAGTLPASYAVEPKIDGVRVLIFANAKTRKVVFKSRNGKAFTSLNHLTPQVLAFLAGTKGDLVLDAEAVSGSFFDTVGQIRSKSEPANDAVLWVFDIINFDKYLDRRAKLETLTPTESVRIVPVQYNVPIQAAFESAKANGFEGIIIKDTASEYEASERTVAWQKVKDRETHDCKVVEVNENSLVVEFGKVLVSVGSGFTSDARKAIFSNPSAIIGKTIEVACHMLTPDGSMRHPTFLRLRLDK